MDTQCIHQRIAENFLSEVPTRHWLHGEYGDTPVVIHMPQQFTDFGIEITVFYIRNQHNALDDGLLTGCCQHIEEQILTGCLCLDRQCTDDEFAQMVFESLSV